MGEWLWSVVFLVAILGFFLLREGARASAVEKWIVSRGLSRRFPVPPEGPQPAANLVARLSTHGARRWGFVLEGTLDGLPVTVAEHESSTSLNSPPAWFTIVTWPIQGASGRIFMHRGTGSPALANAAKAIGNAVREPLYDALGLSTEGQGAHIETPGGWTVYGDPGVREGWLTPQKMRELDAWPHGGSFVREDGHGAWRVQEKITVENLEKLPGQFAAVRHLLQDSTF
jgi:hypothetical protein